MSVQEQFITNTAEFSLILSSHLPNAVKINLPIIALEASYYPDYLFPCGDFP